MRKYMIILMTFIIFTFDFDSATLKGQYHKFVRCGYGVIV
jgi:hypothetical protein